MPTLRKKIISMRTWLPDAIEFAAEAMDQVANVLPLWNMMRPVRRIRRVSELNPGSERHVTGTHIHLSSAGFSLNHLQPISQVFDGINDDEDYFVPAPDTLEVWQTLDGLTPNDDREFTALISDGGIERYVLMGLSTPKEWDLTVGGFVNLVFRWKVRTGSLGDYLIKVHLGTFPGGVITNANFTPIDGVGTADVLTLQGTEAGLDGLSTGPFVWTTATLPIDVALFTPPISGTAFGVKLSHLVEGSGATEQRLPVAPTIYPPVDPGWLPEDDILNTFESLFGATVGWEAVVSFADTSYVFSDPLRTSDGNAILEVQLETLDEVRSGNQLKARWWVPDFGSSNPAATLRLQLGLYERTGNAPTDIREIWLSPEIAPTASIGTDVGPFTIPESSMQGEIDWASLTMRAIVKAPVGVSDDTVFEVFTRYPEGPDANLQLNTWEEYPGPVQPDEDSIVAVVSDPPDDETIPDLTTYMEADENAQDSPGAVLVLLMAADPAGVDYEIHAQERGDTVGPPGGAGPIWSSGVLTYTGGFVPASKDHQVDFEYFDYWRSRGTWETGEVRFTIFRKDSQGALIFRIYDTILSMFGFVGGEKVGRPPEPISPQASNPATGVVFNNGWDVYQPEILPSEQSLEKVREVLSDFLDPPTLSFIAADQDFPGGGDKSVQFTFHGDPYGGEEVEEVAAKLAYTLPNYLPPGGSQPTGGIRVYVSGGQNPTGPARPKLTVQLRGLSNQVTLTELGGQTIQGGLEKWEYPFTSQQWTELFGPQDPPQNVPLHVSVLREADSPSGAFLRVHDLRIYGTGSAAASEEVRVVGMQALQSPSGAPVLSTWLKVDAPIPNEFVPGDLPVLYVGTQDKIFELLPPDFLWNDVSNAQLWENTGGTVEYPLFDDTPVTGTAPGIETPPLYHKDESKSWSFTTWGDKVIATNFRDPIQVKNPNDVDFRSLIGFDDDGGPIEDYESHPVTGVVGQFPHARFVAAINAYLVIANVGTQQYQFGRPYDVWWSAASDPTRFYLADLSSTSALVKLIGEPGEVTGLIGGEFGLIFKENSIWRMDYVGFPQVFDFEEISGHVGTPFPRSIVEADADVFFWGVGGIYALRNHQNLEKISTGIDQHIFDLQFAPWSLYQTNSDTEAINSARVIGHYDNSSGLIFWAYSSPQAALSYSCDQILVYNIHTQKWSTIPGDRLAGSDMQDTPTMFSMYDSNYKIQGVESVGNRLTTDATSLTRSLLFLTRTGGENYVHRFDGQETYEAWFRSGTIPSADFNKIEEGWEVEIQAVRPIYSRIQESTISEPTFEITVQAGQDPEMTQYVIGVGTSAGKREDGFFDITKKEAPVFNSFLTTYNSAIVSGEWIKIAVRVAESSGPVMKEFHGVQVQYRKAGGW